MQKDLYITEIRDGVYMLDEAHRGTGYLVVGDEKACVIDTMNCRCNLYEAVREITDKPIILVNTHGHPDHIAGNRYFESAYMHPADLETVAFYRERPALQRLLAETGKDLPPFLLVKEGDVFDLGGKHLYVYDLPGHTPGSILLLLKEERILFVGDSANHELWMQLRDCLPLKAFAQNLERVLFLENEADTILHGHALDYDDISLLRCILGAVKELCEGKTEKDRPYFWSGGEVRQHPYECLPGKHYSKDTHVIVYKEEKLPEEVRRPEGEK